MLSLDIDCNPEYRRIAPLVYGYVPNGATRRLVVFTSMVTFSALHITLKVLGVALLAILDRRIVGAMLGGDLLIYVSYKILRNDFYHWLPLVGPLATFVSFVVRCTVKVLVDFTAVIHFRESGSKNQHTLEPTHATPPLNFFS